MEKRLVDGAPTEPIVSHAKSFGPAETRTAPGALPLEPTTDFGNFLREVQARSMSLDSWAAVMVAYARL